MLKLLLEVAVAGGVSGVVVTTVFDFVGVVAFVFVVSVAVTYSCCCGCHRDCCWSCGCSGDCCSKGDVAGVVDGVVIGAVAVAAVGVGAARDVAVVAYWTWCCQTGVVEAAEDV